MIALTKRNIMVFFRSKTALPFSILVVLIILAIYVFFLGDAMAEDLDNMKGIRTFLDSWLMAGLLTVISVTSTLGAFGIMVEDKNKRIVRDFISSPLSMASLLGGYILTAFIIGMMISVAALIIAEAYIFAAGGELLSAGEILQVLRIIVLSVSASSALMFFLVSHIKNHSTFSAVNTMTATLIGFLAGIYLPIGKLPEVVQLFIKIFPISHSGVLLRQVMTEQSLEGVFNGAPPDDFQAQLGLEFTLNNHLISQMESAVFLTVTTILFYFLGLLAYPKKYF